MPRTVLPRPFHGVLPQSHGTVKLTCWSPLDSCGTDTRSLTRDNVPNAMKGRKAVPALLASNVVGAVRDSLGDSLKPASRCRCAISESLVSQPAASRASQLQEGLP